MGTYYFNLWRNGNDQQLTVTHWTHLILTLLIEFINPSFFLAFLICKYEFITCALSMYILIRQSLWILLWKPLIGPHLFQVFRTISVIGNRSLSPQTCAPRRQAKYRLNNRELILGSCYNFTNALDTYKELTIDFENRETKSTHQLFFLSLVGMSAATNQRNHLLTGAPFSSFRNAKPWIESGEVYFSRGSTEDSEHSIGKSIAEAAQKTRPLYPGKNKGIHKD